MEYYNFNALEEMAEDVAQTLIKNDKLKLVTVREK